MSAWESYWFAHGGRMAAAVLRIALALAVLLTVARLAAGDAADPLAPLAHPPASPLAASLDAADVATLRSVAVWAAIALLVGLATRAAAAVALAALLAVALASPPDAAAIAHDSLPLLALLGFLGARGGDTLALDSVVRRLRRRPPHVVAGGYQWSVRLVQIAVALALASASVVALHAGQSPAAALADDLRHQLATGDAHRATATWLLADTTRLQLAAALELVLRLLPIGAVFALRRPWLRAACGAAYVIALVGRGAVLGAWNPAWLVLAVVFVDWDALVDWLAERVVRQRAPSPPVMPYHHRVATSFIVVFLAAELALAFVAPWLGWPA